MFHTGYVAERLGDKPYHEALTVLTAVAAQTTTVRLGTSVLVLPWHHPVRLAKTLASLDDLSSGRVVLGVGVAILLAVQLLQERYGSVRVLIGRLPTPARWALWYGLALAVITLGVESGSQFIYFQF